MEKKTDDSKDPRKMLLATGKTKEVNVRGFSFTLKKLSYHEVECIQRKAEKLVQGKPQVDSREFNKQLLVESVVKSPFSEWESATIDQLELQVAMQLVTEALRMTFPASESEKNSEPASGGE